MRVIAARPTTSLQRALHDSSRPPSLPYRELSGAGGATAGMASSSVSAAAGLAVLSDAMGASSRPPSMARRARESAESAAAAGGSGVSLLLPVALAGTRRR